MAMTGLPRHPSVALQLGDAAGVRLRDLEATLEARERDLDALKVELQGLQDRYLTEIGVLYRDLAALESDIMVEEVRAGLRPSPEGDAPEVDDGGNGPADNLFVHRTPPSDDLKRAFRDLAKAIHPDLAFDDAARYRRHSLMAEANRAYAERDEDRLRLILHAWRRSPESVIGDDPEADRQRVERRAAEIDERLVAIEAEFADLRRSAIFRLKGKIDDAKAGGWDLFAEMRLQTTAEIRRATARLGKLKRL